MTGKEFLNALANGETDLLQVLLGLLEETEASHCVIEGLAVNAFDAQLGASGAARPAPRTLRPPARSAAGGRNGGPL